MTSHAPHAKPNSPHSQFRRFVIGTAYGVALSLIAAGCARHHVEISNIEQASQLITSTLNAWQAGNSLDELRDSSPPIYVAEELWQNGIQLVRFDVTQPGELFGTNVRFHVKLTCSDKERQTVHAVKYLVTTTPAYTIAREDR